MQGNKKIILVFIPSWIKYKNGRSLVGFVKDINVILIQSDETSYILFYYIQYYKLIYNIYN